MIIEFYNDKGEIILTYEGYQGDAEIEATKELLEYENNCTVRVEVKG